jgi:ACS family glucarate transporter-like MFS transporter
LPQRYAVIGGLFLLSVITYLDRAAISSVKAPLVAELGLTDQQFGFALSIFALGYALGQVPSGWLADKLGPRVLLAAIVALWSILTAATGAVASFAALIAVRFFFGLAEAGAFPGAARAFYNWLPPSEHGRANGIVFSGSRLGGAIAFPLMAWLLAHGDWRNTFYALTLPGLLWAAGWFLRFRNHPKEPAAQAPQAAERHEGRPLPELIRETPIWRAMLQYFGANFTTFLCLSWMNPYLKERYKLNDGEAAFYSMIPLLIAAGAQWATGAYVDHLYSTGRRDISRSRPASFGFAVSALGAAMIPFAPTPAIAAACFSIATFGAEMTISPSWAFCLDLGGKHAGSVSGTMNMAGNLGSFVSANAFPWLRNLTGDAGAYFALVCVLNAIGIACWNGMKPPANQRVSSRT